MNLRERLTKVAEDAIKEGVESSKDIIGSNVVPSFDDMGMANVQPGEFAQEEITDKQNLVNQGSMSNDTEFNKEGECPVKAAVDAATDMLSDLVDISAPETDSTIEIVKTSDGEHAEDCRRPDCCHKHHHEHMGEAKLKEDQNKPLFMYNPQLEKLYTKWNAVLNNPTAKRPPVVNSEVIEDLNHEGLTPETCSASQFVWNDMNNAMGNYEIKAPEAWDSLVDRLIADAKKAPNVSSEDLEAFNVLHTPARAESVKSEFGESAMAKTITKLLGGKTCEEYLRETVQLKESDFTGPKDFVPDARINVSAVLNAIKQEVGEGSEGVHVDAELDERHNNCYKVSQIDLKKLPKTLNVDTTELKLDDDTYKTTGPTDEYPVNK